MTLPIKRRNLIIIIVVIVAAAVVVGGIFGFNAYKKAKEKEYFSNMSDISYEMLSSAAEAETAGGLVVNVWHNAIWENRDSKTNRYTMKNGKFVDDFNDALSALYTDKDFAKNIAEIKADQAEIDDLMQKLKNPPKKYQSAYNALKEYYDDYTKFANLVINPSGSLQTFSANFNAYDTQVLNSYNEMKFYLE